MCFRVCIFLFFFLNGRTFWLLSPLFVVVCFVVVCINISMEMVRPNLFKLSQQQKSTLCYFNYVLHLFLDLLPVITCHDTDANKNIFKKENGNKTMSFFQNIYVCKIDCYMIMCFKHQENDLCFMTFDMIPMHPNWTGK